MSQPDEFETRFNEAPDPEPELIPLMPLSREALLRAAWLLSPADRLAPTAGGSPRLTDETPGPAIDLFGRLAR